MRSNIKRILFACGIAVMLIVLPVIPTGAVTISYPNMAGTWHVSCKIPVKMLDGTKITTVTSATITVVTNTTTSNGVISSATITVGGYSAQAVTGFVAKGSKVSYCLMGGGADIGVVIKGTCWATNNTAYKLDGNVTGICYHSQGGTLASDESGSAAYSSVSAHNSSVSVLLTQAASAGSTHVDITPPMTNFKLSDLDTIIASKWGLWYNLQNNKSGMPQLELRFAASTNVNPDGAGHVDVTIMAPKVGDGTWTNLTFGQTSLAMYYGNDPWDGTAFYNDAPEVLSGIEAEINAESAMTANGGFSASNWVLTRVRVELWDGGIRTCYVDDININSHLITFEAVQFAGTFLATK